MTAIDFLPNRPAAVINRPRFNDLTTVKPENFTIPNNIVTSYHIITLLGREVADNIEIFAEKGICGTLYVKRISRGFSADIDETERAAKQSGRFKEWKEDFILINRYFQSLAESSLSGFQRKSSPNLCEVLKTILIIDFSLHTADFIASSLKQRTQPKSIGHISFKRGELLKWFEKNYGEVSNFNFDFAKYCKAWKMINTMNYTQLREFLER